MKPFAQRLALLGVALTGVAAITIPAAAISSSAQADAGSPTLTMTAVIRCSNGVFSTIEDAGHRAFGVKSVSTLSDRVRVYYDVPLAAYGTAFADPDETYTINNIDTGASGALDHMDIFIAKDGVKLTPSQACISGANIWIETKGYLQ